MINIAEYFKYTIENLPREYWYSVLKNLFIKENRICFTKDGSKDIFDEYYFYKKDLKPDFKGRFSIGDIVKLNSKKRYGYVELVLIDIPKLDIRNKTFNYKYIQEYGGSYKAIGIQKYSNYYYQVIGTGPGSHSLFTEDARDEKFELLESSDDPFINLMQKIVKKNNKDELDLILNWLWDEYENDLSEVDLSKEEWKDYYKED